MTGDVEGIMRYLGFGSDRSSAPPVKTARVRSHNAIRGTSPLLDSLLSCTTHHVQPYSYDLCQPR
jgi:hypothetical protein